MKRDLSLKSKDIAWIVSHCETDSKREAYVEKLQKITSLKIDVYGKCGKQGLKLSARPVESQYGKLRLPFKMENFKNFKISSSAFTN